MGLRCLWRAGETRRQSETPAPRSPPMLQPRRGGARETPQLRTSGTVVIPAGAAAAGHKASAQGHAVVCEEQQRCPSRSGLGGLEGTSPAAFLGRGHGDSHAAPRHKQQMLQGPLEQHRNPKRCPEPPGGSGLSGHPQDPRRLPAGPQHLLCTPLGVPRCRWAAHRVHGACEGKGPQRSPGPGHGRGDGTGAGQQQQCRRHRGRDLGPSTYLWHLESSSPPGQEGARLVWLAEPTHAQGRTRVRPQPGPARTHLDPWLVMPSRALPSWGCWGHGCILHASTGMPRKMAWPRSGMGTQHPPTRQPQERGGRTAEKSPAGLRPPRNSPHIPTQNHQAAPFAAFSLKMYIRVLKVQIFTTVYKCTKPDRR